MSRLIILRKVNFNHMILNNAVDLPVDNNPDSSDYVFYEIEKVLVNGETQAFSAEHIFRP